ncbi:MAG: RNA 3'-terminal phosphate cyclase [Chloroherpetonaceae bacterium]|nr:RNA 3'-terminal phosphate cyclase [Chthonomonadaceae bacterium]MDW8207777.1 RNA 3'-terminal phosphate cyclase [Chloroherpetonaceae bacterium]
MQSSETSSSVLQIDGATGEGGGQIIRNALALSAISGRAVEIVNIRAGREKPGLQPQHLTAVRAIAELCTARLDGDTPGSLRLHFVPTTSVRPGHYAWQIGTAGATALVLQTVLLPLCVAGGPSQLTIGGGTHVPAAPTADYLQQVYLPALARVGLQATLTCPAAGFYPRGGGEIRVQIDGNASLAPVHMVERGRLRSLRAWIVTSNLPDHVAERGAAAIAQFMKGIGRTVDIEPVRLPSPGTGATVLIAAECAGGLGGFTGMGRRGLPVEKVALAPCEAFLQWWKTGAACDDHLADQLVLPAVLARGESQWTVAQATSHLRTALWLARQFQLIDYALQEPAGAPVQVIVRPRTE